MMLLECRACVLDERAVADAGRTGRLAGAAGEAAVEMQPQRVRRLEPPRGELLHEMDAASWRLRLEAGEQIRRARFEAHSAVDAAARRLDVEREGSENHGINATRGCDRARARRSDRTGALAPAGPR